jgi:tRNA threonylcarbamoyladenosine biosynthesis protein TsaE
MTDDLMASPTLRFPAETDSADATVALGRALAARLAPGAVVALHGDLGAGKTHLVKGIAEGLGGRAGDVTSPTFTLVHEVETDPPLVHADLYRVESEAEAAALGLDEWIAAGDAVVVVEWPERAPGLWPADTLHLHLAHLGGDRRRLTRLP